MKNQKPGIHVGHNYYKPKPVTIVLICVIILALLAGAFFLFKDAIFGAKDPSVTAANTGSAAVATPSPTPADMLVPVTPTPVVEATAEPTVTPKPTPTAEPTPRAATIRFIGEISVDDNILSAAMQEDGTYSFAEMFSMAAGAVGNADYTIANVEGSMGGVGTGYTGKDKYNTPEIIISDLKDIGVDMLALSNDHALDAGFDGLINTIIHCDEYGMDHVGGYATREEHDSPTIVEINGIDVCVLNYTASLNVREKDVTDESLEYGINLAKNSNSRTDAAAAREAGADVVVAIISWGTDGENSIDDTQKQIAQILLESGVDVVIGYGPRCVQAVLWLEQPAAEATEGEEPAEIKNTLCCISVGTFLSSSEKRGLDCGTIFEFTISEQEDGTFAIENPTSIPTYVWQYTNEDSTIEYRVLACGEWLEEQPEGMSDEDYARMMEIWEGIPSVVTEASTPSAN